MRSVRKLIMSMFQILLFPFPWWMRRFLYCLVFGYKLDKSSKIRYSIVLAKKLEMADNSRIGNFNFISDIDALKLGTDSGIGTLNYISGYPTDLKTSFSHIVNRRCELVMKSHCGITSRHFIDCTAGIYLDDLTTIIGVRSQILTHSINIYSNRQEALSVYLGKGCLIGTGSIILPGSNLPSYSILAAFSLLNKYFKEEICLYGGVPAKKIKNLNKSSVLYFSRIKGNVE